MDKRIHMGYVGFGFGNPLKGGTKKRLGRECHTNIIWQELNHFTSLKGCTSWYFGLDSFWLGTFWLGLCHLRKGEKLLWATVRHIVFLILILGRKAWILERAIGIKSGQIGVGLMVDRWIR